MRYLLALLFSFGFIMANAQNDQFETTDQPITCAYIDANTLACYSPGVDTNNDGVIDQEEWNNAEVDSRGIIELDNTRQEDEIFDTEGIYDTEGLYEEEGLYDEESLYEDEEFNTGVYDEGIQEDEGIYDTDAGTDEVDEAVDYDLFDDEEDGAFQ